MKITIAVIKVFFIGALFIISGHDLYLSDSDQRAQFYDLYQGWLSGLYDEVVLVTKYFAKSGWLPTLPDDNPSYIQSKAG